jgi:pimeloyl-ACP methyl ester carboxylesterase
VKLNIRTWGHSEDPVCLLLHGITGNAGSWTALAPRLADEGFHVVAPEMRGHGESPRGDNYSTAVLLNDLVENVPTAPSLLIGHSFGGYLAEVGVLSGLLHPRAVVLEDPVTKMPDRVWATRSLEFDRDNLPRSIDGMLQRESGWSRVDAAWKILSLEQVDWAGAIAAFGGNAPWDLRHRSVEFAQAVPALWILPPVTRFNSPEDFDLFRAAAGEDHVAVVDNAGHSVHRDQLETFLRLTLDFYGQQPTA